MTTTAPPSTRTRTDRPPARRLPYRERRAQLVETAAPVVAEQGLAEFSLDDVAAGAGVTRNLLYHYFPRGRHDVILAVAEWAGRKLTEGWTVDESVPLPERMATNFQRFASHAMEPSVAWRLSRMGQSAGDPEIDTIISRFHEIIVSGIALNQLGTTDPPPLVRIAIRGVIALGESVLDQARDQEIRPERALQLVAQALIAAVRGAVEVSQ